MEILKRISESRKNSVLHLALLSLLYLIFTSNYISHSNNFETPIYNNQNILIEISEDGVSTVKSVENSDELLSLQSDLGISEQLKTGDKIVIDQGQATLSSINGRKKIALGLPIGINSATQEDLTAIPGIGEELSLRIINYRETKGHIYSLDELDNVDGIGHTKLEEIKKVANLD